jgi:hypothetical protein
MSVVRTTVFSRHFWTSDTHRSSKVKMRRKCSCRQDRIYRSDSKLGFHGAKLLLSHSRLDKNSCYLWYRISISK